MQQTNGPKTLCVAGGHAKDTDLVAAGRELLTTIPGLENCLEAIPHFAFSEVGRRNLCRRFYLSEQSLEVALQGYTEKGGVHRA